jgi:hypothetical protein
VAIGPDKMNVAIEREADEFEREIDALLEKAHPQSYGDASAIHVTVKTKKHPSINIELILKQRYLAAGWKKFEAHDDQRDGHWIALDA